MPHRRGHRRRRIQRNRTNAARNVKRCPPNQHWMPPTAGRAGYCMQGASHSKARNTNVTRTKAVSGNDKPIIKRTQTGTQVIFEQGNSTPINNQGRRTTPLPYGQQYQGPQGGAGDFHTGPNVHVFENVMQGGFGYWGSQGPSQFCEPGGVLYEDQGCGDLSGLNTPPWPGHPNCCHGRCSDHAGCQYACGLVCDSFGMYANNPQNYGSCDNHDGDDWTATGLGSCVILPPEFAPPPGEPPGVCYCGNANGTPYDLSIYEWLTSQGCVPNAQCHVDTDCPPNTQEQIPPTPRTCNCYCHPNN